MSLKDIQAQVDEWTSQFTPQYWKQHEILAQMQEELGEIGRILNRVYGPKPPKEGETINELGNELSDKLIKEFGTSKINDALLERTKKHTKDLHYLLKRKIFFSHRDFDWILNEYEKGNKFFLYTGRAPSSHTHLGHLVPWMFTKWLQDKFKVDLWVQFPDEEKFLFKENLTLKDTEKYTYENMLDVIAVGFDPKRTKFLVDTKHANLMYKEAIKVA